ncbi:MAG: hypothetical protein ABIO67_00870, partial [Mycobacteriales bacterium]
MSVGGGWGADAQGAGSLGGGVPRWAGVDSTRGLGPSEPPLPLDGLGEGLADAEALADALGDDDPEGDELALGEPDGAALPDGLGLGVGCGSPDGLATGVGDGLSGAGDVAGLGASVGSAKPTKVSDAATGGSGAGLVIGPCT